jgi:2-polyprenyl-6-methoxyphenol hydroxylase-like FAD-dependent oxidoreductase
VTGGGTVTGVRPASTGVIIAGAGPAGLLLACELRRAGIPVVIVDRLASPMTESRASQLTALSAELLDERGFGALLSEAQPEPRAHFGGLAFGLSNLASDYPGNWKVPQYRTEAALAERAESLGATLLRAHEMTGVTSADDHVTCTVRARTVGGGAEELHIRASYLVGCDGAQSTVRRLCGFTSSVTAATRELLRADVIGIDIPDRRFERLEGGFAAAASRDGVTRVMVHARGAGLVERTTPPSFAEVAQWWKRVTGDDISGGSASWVDAFDNARGQADRYRQGHVFLAGDAAHWHLPIGGQALNTGLQDAVNLGWKLAGAMNGWAAPGLLDTYHCERHPAAERVLRYVAAQETVLLGGTEIEPLRTVLAELIERDEVRDHLASVVSNLGDRYGPASDPLAGRRLRGLGLRGLGLRDGHGGPAAHMLAGPEPVIVRVTAPGPAPSSAGGALDEDALRQGFRIRVLRGTAARSGPLCGVSAILVRPDGYIAWAGADGPGLDQAIRQLFGDVRRRNR